MKNNFIVCLFVCLFVEKIIAADVYTAQGHRFFTQPRMVQIINDTPYELLFETPEGSNSKCVLTLLPAYTLCKQVPICRENSRLFTGLGEMPFEKTRNTNNPFIVFAAIIAPTVAAGLSSIILDIPEIKAELVSKPFAYLISEGAVYTGTCYLALRMPVTKERMTPSLSLSINSVDVTFWDSFLPGVKKVYTIIGNASKEWTKHIGNPGMEMLRYDNVQVTITGGDNGVAIPHGLAGSHGTIKVELIE